MLRPEDFTIDAYRLFRATYVVAFETESLTVKYMQRIIGDRVHIGWHVAPFEPSGDEKLSFPSNLRDTDLAKKLQTCFSLNPIAAELWVYDFELFHADVVEEATRIVGADLGPNDANWSMFCTDFLGLKGYPVEFWLDSMP